MDDVSHHSAGFCNQIIWEKLYFITEGNSLTVRLSKAEVMRAKTLLRHTKKESKLKKENS